MLNLKCLSQEIQVPELSLRHWCQKGYIKGEKYSYKGHSIWFADKQEAKNFKKLHYCDNTTYKVGWNRMIFDDIDTPEKAYWLGFLTADSCIYDKQYGIAISLGGKDYKHLEKFEHFLQLERSLIKIKEHTITHNPIATIRVSSKHTVERLIDLGLKARKSGKEQFIHTSFDRDFIRGVWDGDGCIRSDLTSIDLVGSYELLQQVQQYFKKVLQVQPHKIQKHGCIYRIYYCSKKDVKLICSHLWQDSDEYMSLDRKFSLAKQIEKIC